MGTTFNFEVSNKSSRKKTFAIYLRITQNRKKKRIKSSIEVNRVADFNLKAKQGNWIRTSESNFKVWNQTLEDELEKAKKTYRELGEDGMATKELIKATLQNSIVSTSFLIYAKQRTQDIFNEGGYRNYKKYNGFIKKLESYLKTIKKEDVLFVEITSSFLSKFEAFLHTLRNARNPEATLHPNTLAVNLNIFKTIINRAIELDKIIKPEKNPFLGYKYDKAVSTIKDKLNESEIKRIEELELKKDSLMWHCRNYFLFSFYLAGIRAGDLIQLRWINITSENRIEYRMAKTKKDRNMNLHQKAKDILKLYFKVESKPSDYIFPLLNNEAQFAKAITEEQKATLPPELIMKLNNTIGSKNALINKYLQKIATLAEIDKHISFHIARHSFAKIAKDNKVDNNHLKNLLGHSNIKVTEAYMGNFETEESDNVMASIFGEKEAPKQEVKALLEKMNPEQIEALLQAMKK